MLRGMEGGGDGMGVRFGGLYHNIRSSSVSLALWVQNPEEGKHTDVK